MTEKAKGLLAKNNRAVSEHSGDGEGSGVGEHSGRVRGRTAQNVRASQKVLAVENSQKAEVTKLTEESREEDRVSRHVEVTVGMVGGHGRQKLLPEVVGKNGLQK